MKRILLAAPAILLAGCMTPTNAGSGPMTLSPGVEQAYKRYRGSHNPIAFAVTPDGGGSFFYTCPESVCIDHLEGIDEAVDKCSTRNGVRCYLYDVGGRVVWQFDAPPRRAG